MRTELQRKLNSIYGRHEGIDSHFYFAPGSVCFLGEHLDYNGGTVLSGAIQQGLSLIYRPTFNKILCLSSSQQKKELLFSIEGPIQYADTNLWGNYVLGVYQAFAKKGFTLKGAEILFDSTLPIASGLSSTAAILLLTAYMFNSIYEAGLSKEELAKLSKEVENNFIGLQSGLMDPMSIALSKEHKLLSLDCSTGNYEYIPFKLRDYSLLIFDSKKQRRLNNSAYNERRVSSEKALNLIQKNKDEKLEWKQVYMQDLKNISDKILYKRALHIVSEIQRVTQGKVALQEEDFPAFGKLMTASHLSLKDNYEVSCSELDYFVNIATAEQSCIGAKMTGAGFGGSAVALVERNSLEEFIPKIERAYLKETGLEGKLILSEIGNSLREL